MKEYDLLRKFVDNESTFGNRDHTKCLELLTDTLSSNRGYEFLNLSLINEKIEEIMHFFTVQQRFILLKNNVPSINYDERGFHLDSHTFETIDELEKAIKNKAFL